MSRRVLARCYLRVCANKGSDLDGARVLGEFWVSAVRCEFDQCLSRHKGVLSISV